MKTQTKRGLLAKAGALLAVAALAFSASPAQAQTTDMPTSSGVVITKLVQPGTAGGAATGAEDTDLTGAIAIEGVKFEAYQVPVRAGEDHLTPGTNAWQQQIANTTLKQAQDLVELAPTAVREGETRTDGKIIWDTDVEGTQGDDLDRGLYLVRETSTPAGVIPAADFLLAVPLTNPSPSTPTGWLDTIYVYPKSSKVTGSMSVANDTAYSVGDTVTWTINAEIPQIRDNADGTNFLPTDFFAITDTFMDAQLVNPKNVTVKLGDDPLTTGVGEEVDDYSMTSISNGDDTTTVSITFTDRGLEKLATALTANPKITHVIATIDTTVDSTGEISNKATIHPSGELNGETSFELTTPATVKYGKQPVSVKDSAGAEVIGAQFRVYLTKEGARKRVASEYVAGSTENGYLTTSDTSEDGIFTTGDDGTVNLGGFRYSAFANNTVADPAQTYWLAQVEAGNSQQLLAEPVSFTITDTTEEKEIILSANANGFTLPLTGGTGTTLLTILGLGILAIVLFVARSRRNAEA